MNESWAEHLEDLKKYEEPEYEDYIDYDDLGDIDRAYDKWEDMQLMKDDEEKESDK